MASTTTTTTSRSHGGGAGGRIMRPRRPSRISTPYDRPSTNQNPNWISKFVFSPTRVIASGAGKILSSVLGSDSPQHSSSSSSSSSSYFASVEDSDDNGNDIRVSSRPAIELNHANTSLEMTKDVTEEPRSAVRKTDAKHLIERLIMQETFSWDECDRLSNILKSRVIETPINITRDGGEASEIPGRGATGDMDLPDLNGMAVMEAKKWLKEKKLASNPAPDVDQVVACTPNSLMAQEVTQQGSPVDMAKSYMKARPPWASPCLNISGQSPISPRGLQLHSEDTPFPTGASSLSSSKLKRDPPFSGSWNIMEEIRRVRSRATEEILRAPSASKVDWSGPTRVSSLTNYDWSGSVFGHNRTFDKPEASKGEKLNNSSNLLVDLEMPTVAASQEQLVSQERLEDKVPSSTAMASVSEQSQVAVGASVKRKKDSEGKQIDKGKGLQDGSMDKAAVTERDSRHTSDPAILENINQQHDVAAGIGIADSSFLESSPLMSDNGTTIGGASAANGFPCASLSAGVDTKDFNQRPHDDGINPTSSSLPASPLLETCELLSEASMEVPNVNENDIFGNGSQNSPSMHVEEFLGDFDQENTKQVAVRKRGSVTMKQQPQKATRYSKRSRARGK